MYNQLLGINRDETQEKIEAHNELCGKFKKKKKDPLEKSELEKEYICHEYRRVIERKETRDSLIENRGYGRISSTELAKKGKALEEEYENSELEKYEV